MKFQHHLMTSTNLAGKMAGNRCDRDAGVIRKLSLPSRDGMRQQGQETPGELARIATRRWRQKRSLQIVR